MEGTTPLVAFGHLNQLQEQPAELCYAFVLWWERGEMPVSPAVCMAALEQGSLDGSNQLHAEPTRRMTA